MENECLECGKQWSGEQDFCPACGSDKVIELGIPTNKLEGIFDEPQCEEGFPGDGSGMDDFQDFNQRESEDYREE